MSHLRLPNERPPLNIWEVMLFGIIALAVVLITIGAFLVSARVGFLVSGVALYKAATYFGGKRD